MKYQKFLVFFCWIFLSIFLSCLSTQRVKKFELKDIQIYNPTETDSCYFVNILDLSRYERYRLDSLRFSGKYMYGTIIDLIPPQSDSIRFSKRYFEGWRPAKPGAIIYLITKESQICTPFKKIAVSDSLGRFKIKIKRRIVDGLLVFGDEYPKPSGYLGIKLKP